MKICDDSVMEARCEKHPYSTSSNLVRCIFCVTGHFQHSGNPIPLMFDPVG